MQAKTRTVAALVAAWLGMAAAAGAQGYPMTAPPGLGQPGRVPPPPLGMVPVGMAGPGLPMPPHGALPPGAMPGGPLPPGAMPPGPIPPGAMPPGMPPGACPPGMGPLGPGIPGNLDREVNRNAFNGTAEDPDACETNPIRWHFMIEPFLMWVNGPRIPPTVTTGDFLFDEVPGALGQPGPRVLFGGRKGDDSIFGSRFTLVYWLADPERLSVDLSYFLTETRTYVFDARSNGEGGPVLTRPFFNPTANRQDADPRALPQVMSGSVHDDLRFEYQGAEANLRWNVTESARLYGRDCILLFGPRWLQLDEHYRNLDRVQELPVGTQVNSYTFSDKFTTSNRFYGGQVGAQFRGRWERLTIDLIGKFVAGYNDQNLRIEGFTRQVDPFGAVVFDNRQGLYVQPSNRGIYSRGRFSWGNEFGMNFGFLLNDNFRFNVGYNFFFIQNMVRAGDQIDQAVNIQPLLSGGGFGVPRPQPIFRESNLVTHVISFGFEFLF